MKHFILLFVIVVIALVNCTITREPGANAVFKWADQELLTLEKLLLTLDSSVSSNKKLSVLKNQFTQTRFQYKRIELLVEYYFQGLTKRINGPALPDIKVEDGQVWPPHGFQVIEQQLYDNYSLDKNKFIHDEVQLLLTDLRFVRSTLPTQPLLDRHAHEIVQHQLIRIVTQGHTGFDSPLAFLSLTESISSLEGIAVFSEKYFENKSLVDSIQQLIAVSSNYISTNNNFNEFDRLYFLRTYLYPISATLLASYEPAASDTLFTKPFSGGLIALAQGNFNSDFFVNYASGESTQAKSNLGKRLFYETGLSKSKTLSCASCHNPALYFTDGKAKAANFLHGGTLERNTPTLLYAALQASQFYDMRSVTLEDQINEVMNNEKEFDLSPAAITVILNKDSLYRNEFEKAFPGSNSFGSYEIRNAIASYTRTLIPFSSTFDYYLQGKSEALSAQAKKGFNLFMGKAKCGTCHFFPVFNGTVPPWYTKAESEIIGVPQKPIWKNAKIDADQGRYEINKMKELQYSFKTPTVRNAAFTGPYMHNGIYKTLEEVIKFYEVGGGVGIGIDLPYQTLPFDNLQLSDQDKSDMVEFLKSLTDLSISKR